MKLPFLLYLRYLRFNLRRIRNNFQAFGDTQQWWEKGVSVAPNVMIIQGDNALLEIGKGAIIGPQSSLNLENDSHSVNAARSVLQIGENTAIGEFNNIRASGGNIWIGKNCMTGQFVSIIASNHSTKLGSPMRLQPWATERNTVRIEEDSWIGAHAVILPGVRIGTGCIIAAGAVVTHDVPDYAVAAGVPAEIKKYRI